MNYRELRQTEALQACFSQGLVCTVLCSVGFGKTILMFKILMKALDDGTLSEGDRILFLTYTKALYSTYKEEAEIYKELFGRNPFDHFNIEMRCYQSKILEKDNNFNLIWCDEIDMIGPETSKQFNNYDGYRVLMSGTLSDTQMIQGEQSKRDFVFQYAPIAYTYSTEQGIEENILINYRSFKINHTPDNNIKKYKAFKSNNYQVTEHGYIKTISKFIDQIRYSKPYLVKLFGSKLSTFLRVLPSKKEPIQKLIRRLEIKNHRVLVFCKQIKFLEEILGKEYVASGRENNIEELKIKFNEGTINKLGFSKSLKRGFTPRTVTPDKTYEHLALIMVHPVGTYEELKQIIGRTIRDERLNPDKIASIYFFVTDSSYESNWFRRSQYKKSKTGKVTDYLELNLQGEINSSQL